MHAEMQSAPRKKPERPPGWIKSSGKHVHERFNALEDGSRNPYENTGGNPTAQRERGTTQAARVNTPTANNHERPATTLELLAKKLHHFKETKVRNREIRNEVKEAERLFEELKKAHPPNIVAVYDEKLKITEGLETARHLADVYDQIDIWGEDSRLETALDVGGEIIDPDTYNAQQEAAARREKEKAFAKEYAEAEKNLDELNNGRTDAEAQETKGLEGDDLTLPYGERISLLEKKIIQRFKGIKGREPSEEEFDQIVYGVKNGTPSPLSRTERFGQWLNRLGEATLGRAIDAFADQSLQTAVKAYRALEDEGIKRVEDFQKLIDAKAQQEAYREKIKARAAALDPAKQQERTEAIKRRFRMKTETLKEIRKKDGDVLKREKEINRKRRLLAQQKLAAEEQEERLRQKEEGLASKKTNKPYTANDLERDEAFTQAFNKAGFENLVEIRLERLLKENPLIVDPDSEEGIKHLDALRKQAIEEIHRNRAEILAQDKKGGAEDLFFKEEDALGERAEKASRRGLATSSETSTEAEKEAQKAAERVFTEAADVGKRLSETASNATITKVIAKELEKLNTISNKTLEEALQATKTKRAAYIGMLSRTDISPEARSKYSHLRNVLNTIIDLAHKTAEDRQNLVEELEKKEKDKWKRKGPKTVEEVQAEGKSTTVATEDDLTELNNSISRITAPKDNDSESKITVTEEDIKNNLAEVLKHAENSLAQTDALAALEALQEADRRKPTKKKSKAEVESVALRTPSEAEIQASLQEILEESREEAAKDALNDGAAKALENLKISDEEFDQLFPIKTAAKEETENTSPKKETRTKTKKEEATEEWADLPDLEFNPKGKSGQPTLRVIDKNTIDKEPPPAQQKPELAVYEERAQLTQGAAMKQMETARILTREEERKQRERKNELARLFLQEFRNAADWKIQTKEDVKTLAEEMLTYMYSQNFSLQEIKDGLMEFSGTQYDNWEKQKDKQTGRLQKSGKNKLLMVEMLDELLQPPQDRIEEPEAPEVEILGEEYVDVLDKSDTKSFAKSTEQATEEEEPIIPLVQSKRKETRQDPNTPSQEAILKYFGKVGYEKMREKLKAAMEEALQDTEKKRKIQGYLAMPKKDKAEDLVDKYLASYALWYALGESAPEKSEELSGDIGSVNVLLGLGDEIFEHPITKPPEQIERISKKIREEEQERSREVSDMAAE